MEEVEKFIFNCEHYINNRKIEIDKNIKEIDEFDKKIEDKQNNKEIEDKQNNKEIEYKRRAIVGLNYLIDDKREKLEVLNYFKNIMENNKILPPDYYYKIEYEFEPILHIERR